MAEPKEDKYDRGGASWGVFILVGIALAIIHFQRNGIISLLEQQLETEISLFQYYAGAGLFLLLAYQLAKWLGKENRRAIQEAREEELEERLLAQIQAGKVEPYFLYLRPFAMKIRLAYQDMEETEKFRETVTMASLPLEDIETILGKAVHPAEFYALGKKGEAIAAAARLEVHDSQWQTKFKQLAKHAQGILLLPGITEGTAWEMDYLNEHPSLMKKTIFLMPPKPQTLSASIMSGPSLLEEEWALLYEAAREEGFNFPAYDEKGLLFTLHPDAGIRQKATPDWNRPSELGKAIRKLMAPARMRG